MASSQLPAGMRNNNPGNIKFTPTINWQGQLGPSVNTDQGDPQVVFETPKAGMRALAMNVLHKYNNGYTTINQLIAGPGGWTPGYAPGAAGVAAASGLPADQPINMNDPDVLGRVMRGIVTQEQGPSSQQYSDQLIASGIGAAGVKQYDSAGNPIIPQATPAVVSGQSPAPNSSSPAAPPPAQVNSVLDEALGPTASSPATTGDRAADLRAATDAGPPTVSSVLDEALGPATTAPSAPAAAATKDAVASTEATATQPPDLFPGASAFQNAVMGSMPVIGSAVEGAINGVGSRIGAAISGQSPEQQQQAADARQQQVADASPAATIAGDVVGSVLPFSAVGPAGVASKLLGTAADYGRGAIGNAFMRTIAGAGSAATISGADTLARGGTLDQAKNNALIGGAVGAAAPTVLGAVGKGLGAAKNAFFGPSAPQMLSNALVADQNAPSAVNALLAQRGPGATVADLGANTRGLAGGLASLPGKPQSIVVNNLAARASQTGDRLAQDVAGTIGEGQPIGALMDSIINAQKSAADPLYAAVRSQPIQMTPELQEFLSTPLGKSALVQGQQLAANDGVKLGVQEQPTAADVANQVLAGKLTPQQGEQQMASIASGSRPAVPNLNVGILDYAKRALDDQASAAVRAGTNNAARQASGKASQLTGIIDAQVPAYAQARAAFAGPAKVLDAVDMGQQLFSSKTSPEDLQSALAGMSPSEKDGLLAGAQAAVQKAVGNARTDAAGVKALFDSNFGQQKLALLVGQPQADQISAALDRERAFSATNGKVANNSVTSANLAQQRVISPELAGVPQRMASQSSLGLLIAGLEKARSAVTGVYRNAQNAHLANMLTAGPLSGADEGAVAGASQPRNALLAPAAVAGAAQQTNLSPPGMGSYSEPQMVFRNGRWMPRVYVQGANVLAQ